eukprot:TRINITY_DN18923_c0_g1_i1.p1 TRINITY_DN18923_c0_g1~~TRINITY_DN18923_c0_g1_i1.p1  ORF type:complete len:284 (-),score=59.00 TRINITY_DN18923_c0_g1_i1:515-1366(-)
MAEANLQALLAAVPVYAAWDDHEFVNNFDSGVDSTVYRLGKSFFDGYLLPKLANDPARSGGFFTQSFPRAEFFMLDTRSYRDELPMRKDEPANIDTAGRSMLGAKQLEAFEEWLDRVPASKWLIIGSSGMLNPYPGDEDFMGTPECEKVDCASDVWYRFLAERDQLLALISRRAKSKNVMFITGDSHYPGLFKLPGGAFELSASPLAAFGFSPPESAFASMRAKRDVVWIGGGPELTSVYGELMIDDANTLRARITSVEKDGARRILHETSLPWQASGAKPEL